MATINPEDFEELWKSIRDDLHKTKNKEFFFGMDFADGVKGPDWSASGMEREYRSAGRKYFSGQTIAIATTPYFYEWAATRLGISRELAKRLTHMRLYDATPLQVAAEIAKASSLPEVRNSCETYINDLKGNL